MNKTKILFSVLAVFFGAFLFVYGEFDDSPGGQLLGLILVAAGAWGAVRTWKKKSG